MSDQNYKTVDGVKVRKSKFGYAPGDEPSEWKFPLDTKEHVVSAIKLFHHEKGIPPAGMEELKRRIVSAAHECGVDDDEIKRFEARPTQKASEHEMLVPLSDLGRAVDAPQGVVLQRPGAQLREIAVAVLGAWVKGDEKFSITASDLRNIVRNFDKRKNDMVVIDYEHASEQPEVAKGGPVPASGWIHRLSANGKLTALVEWTPDAEQMIASGQYRFFSPAIDWGATDKQTGERQGATLTSGALTNHPFLEELPPIMLSDGAVIMTSAAGGERGRPMSEEKKRLAEEEERRKREEEEKKKLDDGDDDEKALPKLRIRKARKGSKREGQHVLSTDAGDVGYMSEEDLAEHARAHLPRGEDEKEKKEMREAQGRSIILTEIAKDGRVDSQAAIRLSEAGRITFADYIRAQEAEKLVDSAVRAGKILPRNRKFFFRDALDRPAEFAEYAANAPQAVRLDVRGVGDAEAATPDQEIDLGAKKLMSDHPERGLTYAAALKEFLAANPALEQRRRDAILRTANRGDDAAPRNGGVVF